MKTNKKTTKTTTKQNKKTDFERAHHIADLLSAFIQFIPQLSGETIPVLSKEFVLKNLLGLTDEEYELNERLVIEESQNILKAVLEQKKLLEGTQVSQEVRPAKKSRTKEKVN